MHIESQQDPKTGDVYFSIVVPKAFVIDKCEPYGSFGMCQLITLEQGMGIITDAVLMAMHLRLRSE